MSRRHRIRTSTCSLLLLLAASTACTPKADAPSSTETRGDEWPVGKRARQLLDTPHPADASKLMRREIDVQKILAEVYDSVQDEATARRAAPYVTDLISEFGAVIHAISSRPFAERRDAQRDFEKERKNALVTMGRAQGRAGLVPEARAPLMDAFATVRSPAGAQRRDVVRHPKGLEALQACVVDTSPTATSCSGLFRQKACNDSLSAAKDLRSTADQRALASQCAEYCRLFETHPLPALCVFAETSMEDGTFREEWRSMATAILTYEFSENSYDLAKAITERMFGTE